MTSQPKFNYYGVLGGGQGQLLFSWIKFFCFCFLLVYVFPFLVATSLSFLVTTYQYLLKAKRTNPLFRDCVLRPNRNLEFVTFMQPCGPDSRNLGSPDTSTSKFQTSLNQVLVAASTRKLPTEGNGTEGRKTAMQQVLRCCQRNIHE